MIVKLVSPLNIGNALNLVLRGLTASQRVPLTLLRCYSIASSQNLYHFRTQKRSVCNRTKEKGIVQCYCTKFTDKPVKDKMSQTGMILRKQNETAVSVDSNSTLWAREDDKDSSKSLLEEYWDEVSTGDEDPATRRAIIEAGVEILRQEGHCVPNVITPDEWEEILKRDSERSRQRYLRYLYIKENRKRLKKSQNYTPFENPSKCTIFTSNCIEGEDSHLAYGYWRNSLFSQVSDSTVVNYSNNRLKTELKFGQHLVVDLGFDEHMTIQESKSVAVQIRDAFKRNRSTRIPFYIDLCNVSRGSPTMKFLHELNPALYEKFYPLGIHTGSHLDYFPKNELVYITPDAEEVMTTFDPSATYIVGGLVDKTNRTESLKEAKATRESIKQQRLPLDRYLKWDFDKTLTINQTVGILLDLKHSCDWETAMTRNVPRRKLLTEEEIQAEFKKDIEIKIKLRRRARYEGPHFPRNRFKRF